MNQKHYEFEAIILLQSNLLHTKLYNIQFAKLTKLGHIKI